MRIFNLKCDQTVQHELPTSIDAFHHITSGQFMLGSGDSDEINRGFRRFFLRKCRATTSGIVYIVEIGNINLVLALY